MLLSIITITYNNIGGLRKTLASVAEQSNQLFEHIIIDGGSTDGSIEVIKAYAATASYPVKWSSEPDKGIYNAMNKGIEIALGKRIVTADYHTEALNNESSMATSATLSSTDYLQILNSGDIFANEHVIADMYQALTDLNTNAQAPDILYGNMIKKDYNTGKIIGKSTYTEYSLRNFYSSTLNHDCCWIKKCLFNQYGLYDETLKIVSDWKWFLQAIGLGHVKPVYVNIDVTIFDVSGISETSLALRNQERRQVLESVMPPAILWDYDHHAFDMEQMNRLRRHNLYPLVYFIERVLFKLEKWHILR